jgi:hypothetical protein
MWLAVAAITLAAASDLASSLWQFGVAALVNQSLAAVVLPSSSKERPVSDRLGRDIVPGKPWLLAIGKRLQAEYDALAEPVPPRLAALVKQLTDDTVADRNEDATE